MFSVFYYPFALYQTVVVDYYNFTKKTFGLRLRQMQKIIDVRF